jgi:hypothetical protein
MALLVGEPGVGKTCMVSRLAICVLLLAKQVTPDHALRNLWQKGSSEYWNGYVRQKAVIFDDLFQKLDVVGCAESEVMDIIRMISNWTFPLNMADLESKGKIQFDSPLVVGTTNCVNIDQSTWKQVVNNKQAVLRRIHHPIWVSVNEQYAVDGKLNYNKFEEEYTANIAALDQETEITVDQYVSAVPWHAWDAWRIQDYESFSGPMCSQINARNKIHLGDFVKQLAADIVRKQERHKESLGALLDHARLSSRIVPQMDTVIEDEEFSLSSFSAPTVEEPSEIVPDEPQPTWLQRFRSEHRAVNGPTEALRLNGSVRAFAADRPMVTPEQLVLNPDTWRMYWYAIFAGFAGRAERFDSFLKPHLVVIYNNIGLFEDNKFGLTLKSARKTAKAYNEIVSQCCDIDQVRLWNLTVEEYQDIIAELLELANVVHRARELQDNLEATAKEEFSFVAACKEFATHVQTCWSAGGFGHIAMGVVSVGFTIIGTFMIVKAFWGVLKAVVGAIASLFGFPNPTAGPPLVEPVPIMEQNTAMGAMADSSLVNTLSGNTFSLWDIERDTSLGNITFIGGAVAAMPRHYIVHLERKLRDHDISGNKLTLLQANVSERTKPVFTVAEFLSFKRWYPTDVDDLVFVSFPLQVGIQSKRNIITHFLPESKVKAIARAKPGVLLYTLRCEKLARENRVRVTGTQLCSPFVNQVRERPIGDVVPDYLWQSTMDTICGDCGGFLMIRRAADSPAGRLLGIHVGGNNSMGNSYGYVQPISREVAERAMSKLSDVVDEFDKDIVEQGIVLDTEADYSHLVECGLVAGSFEYLGTVRPEDGVSLSPTTCLQRTALYYTQAFGDSGMDIAHLSPVVVDGVKKYPMVQAMQNYQTPVEYVDVPNKKLLFSVAMQRFTDLSATHTRDLLDFEEAVSGPMLMKMKAINRSTSSGYPYVLLGKPGKTAFFGCDDAFEFESSDCKMLYIRVHDIIDKAKQGVRLAHICLDFLKDETRPIAKVEAVATRAISGSPVDYVVAFRMLFGAFMAAMYDTHTESGFTPGINPYKQWWMLASNHLSGGSRSHGLKKYHFDGDFSRFDASEQPFLLWSILDYINEWYNDGPELALARKVLWYEVVHSRHITTLQGKSVHVVQWNKSLPSGHPMTTIINSMYAMFSLVYCYAKTTGDLTGFWEHCWASTNGDDNLNTADETVSDLYNQVTVAEAMKDLHLKYTSGSKDGTLTPHVPFEKLTYLKRRFRRDVEDEHQSGGWTCPLEEQSFLFSSYFTKNKRAVAHDIIDKLEFALCELCLHEPERWELRAPQIFEVFRDLGHAPLYGYSRDAYVQNMRLRKDFWY